MRSWIRVSPLIIFHFLQIHYLMYRKISRPEIGFILLHSKPNRSLLLREKSYDEYQNSNNNMVSKIFPKKFITKKKKLIMYWRLNWNENIFLFLSVDMHFFLIDWWNGIPLTEHHQNHYNFLLLSSCLKSIYKLRARCCIGLKPNSINITIYIFWLKNELHEK